MSVIRNIRISGFVVKKNSNVDKTIKFKMEFLKKVKLTKWVRRFEGKKLGLRVK